MATLSIERPVSPLRQRMLDNMTMRATRSRTQHENMSDTIGAFAAFLRRSPDIQLYQRAHGVGESSINGSVSALRFLFDVTL